MTSLVFSRPELLPVAVIASGAGLSAFARALRARRRLDGLYPARGWRGWWLAGNAARLAALLLLSLAALGPGLVVEKRVPVEQAVLLGESRTPAVEHVVMVDVSKSMAGHVDQAAGLLRAYLSALPGSARVVVFAFAGNVSGPLCSGAPGDCLRVADELPRLVGERYTAIGDALLAALSYGRASGLPVAAVVVTDGANNHGSPVGDALRAARAAKVPVVFLLAGGDPRAAKLLEEARRYGALIVYSAPGAGEAAAAAARRAAAEAELAALKSRGEAFITVRSVSQLPSSAAALAAALLAAASRLLDGA